MQRRRLWLSGAVITLAAALASACLSPALPLPPPGTPEVSTPDANGYTRIVGRVPGGSTAFSHNLRSQEIVGVVTEESGRYELSMQARSGDVLSIYYMRGIELSPTTRVVVPDAEGGVGGAAGADNQ